MADRKLERLGPDLGLVTVQAGVVHGCEAHYQDRIGTFPA